MFRYSSHSGDDSFWSLNNCRVNRNDENVQLGLDVFWWSFREYVQSPRPHIQAPRIYGDQNNLKYNQKYR